MTAAEQGFLLLGCALGDASAKPLTGPQLRELSKWVNAMGKPSREGSLTMWDLQQIGCSKEFSQRVLRLLSRKEQLQSYLKNAAKKGCEPVTRISLEYPASLRKKLGLDAPGVLWLRGNRDILNMPAVSLVGSRDLQISNRRFAAEVGRQAAKQGYALVSGNARGADRLAQDSCLENGGYVISVVADALEAHSPASHILYIARDGYNEAFTGIRALQRNLIIHAMGEKTFVAGAQLGKGGTWSGTRENLQKHLSPVFCYADGSDAATELSQMGAVPVGVPELSDMKALQPTIQSFL